jgi:hypothetical protein
MLDVLQQVVSTQPPALRSLSLRLPRDLQTICHKCLRTDPARVSSAGACQLVKEAFLLSKKRTCGLQAMSHSSEGHVNECGTKSSPWEC